LIPGGWAVANGGREPAWGQDPCSFRGRAAQHDRRL